MTDALALALPGLDGIGKVLVFLLTLSVLIVLHEGGHFLLARWNGVRVNEFALGFGPALLKWTSKRSGTAYRLNVFPVGGYCAMQGEDGKSTEAEQQRAFRSDPVLAADNFQGKRPLQRLGIVLAGPIANFILAYAIYVIAAVSFGIATDGWSTKVGPLVPGSPAAAAGLQVGDDLVAIDGVRYASGKAIVDKIKASIGVPLHVTYLRHGAETTVTITPRAEQVDHKTVGRIGFALVPVLQRVGPAAAIAISWYELRDGVAAQLGGLGQLVAHPVERASNLSGVIGMGRAAGEVQDLGWGQYFSLAAMISIALGIFNLLPIPALDGGRASFIVAEMLRGRPVDAEKEALVHFTGFAVIMMLMVFVAYHDVANIVAGKAVF